MLIDRECIAFCRTKGEKLRKIDESRECSFFKIYGEYRCLLCKEKCVK